MKQNRVIIVLTLLLLLSVSFLTLHLHREGTREILSRFQNHQLSYAKHLSNQIQFFIQARSRGLQALSSFPSFQAGNLKQQKRDIESYAKQIGKVFVKAVSLHSASGTVIYSSDPAMIGLKEAGNPLLAWAQHIENKGKLFLATAFHEKQSLLFILCIPLYQEGSGSGRSQSESKFMGVLSFTLDMKEFLINQLLTIDPKMNLDQVWIMDQDGTLLFQPDHPEMVSRNIFQQEGDCRSCHLSFSYTEEILSKRHGILDYTIMNHPKKIAAFALMEFENVSWAVVVNASYNQVTGFIKKSLKEHLLLIGIVVIAFAAGSGLILRKERMKLKAEEEVSRWQITMAERQKAEEALAQERNRLKGILSSMNDGVYIVNGRYEILYTNPVITKDLGPPGGKKCFEFLHGLSTVCSWCKMKEVLAGETVRWEWYSLKTGRTYDVYDTPFTGPDGARCKLQFTRDISGRKQAERALRQSEKQYRLLVETMNDGLGVQDEHGYWIYVNDKLCEMLGASREEIVGWPVIDFLPEADQMIYREQVEKRRSGAMESYGLTWSKKNGEMLFTRVSPKAIFDERGQFKGSFAVFTDITERKKAEEALKQSEQQLRALSSQLLTAQETERKRISRELHDELGQSLTVLKLRLNFIEKNLLKNQADLRQECEIGVHNINRLIENIRRLSRDLSPTILEDFGLSAALRWLVNHFAKNYNIKVNLNMMDIDGLLPRASHVAVYRTVQEALTNIGKHARANAVSITVNEEDQRILLSIEDDGIGFDARTTLSTNPEEKGLGLATMRGRAEMVGGTIEIRTEEGKGTRILMSFPRQPGEI